MPAEFGRAQRALNIPQRGKFYFNDEFLFLPFGAVRLLGCPKAGNNIKKGYLIR